MPNGSRTAVSLIICARMLLRHYFKKQMNSIPCEKVYMETSKRVYVRTLQQGWYILHIGTVIASRM